MDMAKTAGLRRLFLHAHALNFELDGKSICIEAGIDRELQTVCDNLVLGHK